MPGPDLSLPEREEISRALTLDPTVSWASLAALVDRHPTTIAREVDRNGGRDRYRAALADRRAGRCVRRPRQRLLRAPGDLRDRVTRELRAGPTPYAIAADLAAENISGRPCVENDLHDHLRRPTRGQTHRVPTDAPTPPPVPTGPKPQYTPGLPNISDRPDQVNDRSEVRHWEAGQMIGARNRSSMLTPPTGDPLQHPGHHARGLHNLPDRPPSETKRWIEAKLR